MTQTRTSSSFSKIISTEIKKKRIKKPKFASSLRLLLTLKVLKNLSNKDFSLRINQATKGLKFGGDDDEIGSGKMSFVV